MQTAFPVVVPTATAEQPGIAAPLSVKLMAPENWTAPAAPLTVAVKLTCWFTVAVLPEPMW